MSDQCCYVTSGSQFPKTFMNSIHGTMQEQKLLWAMAKELKKRRENVIIHARAGHPTHVCLMAVARVQVLTLVCQDAGVLEEVEALIKTMDNKEARNE